MFICLLKNILAFHCTPVIRPGRVWNTNSKFCEKLSPTKLGNFLPSSIEDSGAKHLMSNMSLPPGIGGGLIDKQGEIVMPRIVIYNDYS